MTLSPGVLALLIAAVEPTAPPVASLPEKPFDPFDVVGVCAVKSETRTWAVVWHPGAGGFDSASIRVFRHLEAKDIDDCLTLLIESDDTTRQAVLQFASNPTNENALLANRAARRRWSAFGVDQAIREVAETGARGPNVERVLVACREVRVPVTIIGAGSDGSR